MSRLKKRTGNGRLTREAVEIIIEMLEEEVVQGKLRQADWCERDPKFYRDDPGAVRPYRIGGLWYTEALTAYHYREDSRDIIGFTWKADRKEFKRRWRERYPKEAEPETKVEIPSESKTKLTYPLFAKSRTNGAIILFTSQKTGVCVVKGLRGNRYGEWSAIWASAADTDHWQHLIFAEAEAEIFGEKND